jgi:hypothetical protein
MSQNSLTLPTVGVVSGLTMTQDTNAALDSLNTLNSGNSAPSSAQAGSVWHNTSSNLVNINSLNLSSWVPLFYINETNYNAGWAGTKTNDNALSSAVGEYLTSSVGQTTTGISSNTGAIITSIVLTAGDWDVRGNGLLSLAASSTCTGFSCGINTVASSLPAVSSGGFATIAATLTTGGNPAMGLMVGPVRVSVSSNTTVYLNAQATFGVSTAGIFGNISARRVR